MPSHPVVSLYEPTAEEEAYAVYVYNKLFGSAPMDGLIHVEAKMGLRVLALSGVDGIILRTIWSVADPDNLRCLTYLSQFHVVLRLIALAQDGLLEKEINRAFTQQRNYTTPVTVFQKTLWMSSDYRDCPLPSFEGVEMPTKEFLAGLSARIKGIAMASSPAPAPAPTPLRNLPTPAPAPAPLPKDLPAPVPAPIPVQNRKSNDPTTTTSNVGPSTAGPRTVDAVAPDPIPNEIRVTKRSSSDDANDIESAIQQIEKLGVDNPNPNAKILSELDPDNLELLQEQAALQRAIMESNKATKPAPASKPAPKKPAHSSYPENDELSSVDAALQRAIYESTHAASPPRPTKNVAAIPKKDENDNWLRMASLQDSSSECDNGGDDDSDDEYRKKKAKKGDVAYAEYIASLNPSLSEPPQKPPPVKSSSDESRNSDEADRKPAAKPPPTKSMDFSSKTPKIDNRKPASQRSDNPPQKDTSKSGDRDEYPQAVQELVINGFTLEKAMQGYKMVGPNFDDIVLFLTSSMAVKEMVINGFNIHKVVEAVDMIGENEDDLLQFLMANEATL
ncbi:Mpv17 / PMP22 family [Seminavis robusta]|uniref:Mpv17 / PMP22 family n=1 Tax=Seminavis robusta TaxID=568900 RepID=A0A9N8H907_9STRA|nr:Mpv17 / PMP22 family [Seminavis robusta]|eukprot:Sro104_g052860.1 Mpv17 / PMP22 family (561) ;mRNA; f:63782-65872